MKATQKKLTQLEQEYLSHVRRAQARKMPLAQYCRAQGLNVQSLYNLRYQLSGKRGLQRRAVPAQTSKPPGKFIAVRVAPTAAPASAACRLHVKGWVIECTSLPPTAWVAGLLAGDADAVS